MSLPFAAFAEERRKRLSSSSIFVLGICHKMAIDKDSIPLSQGQTDILSVAINWQKYDFGENPRSSPPAPLAFLPAFCGGEREIIHWTGRRETDGGR